MGPTDLDSFEAIALPHRNHLRRTAASILGNPTEADDVIQETYLQAWKSFHRFMPGTNCRAWLFKILFHVIAHHRRKWFNRFVFEEPSALEGTLATRTPVPEHLTDPEFIAAFRKIPQQFAEVVMLADVEEFSYKEIHRTLGIPIGTVMSRLSRGRQSLRVHLAPLARMAAVRTCSARAAGASAN